MAKKAKKKADTTATPSAASSAAASSSSSSSSSAAASAVDKAFAAGNYAAVRALAKTDGSEHAKKLLELTKIDMGQVAVGGIAVLVVTIVALLTLH